MKEHKNIVAIIGSFETLEGSATFTEEQLEAINNALATTAGMKVEEVAAAAGMPEGEHTAEEVITAISGIVENSAQMEEQHSGIIAEKDQRIEELEAENRELKGQAGADPAKVITTTEKGEEPAKEGRP